MPFEDVGLKVLDVQDLDSLVAAGRGDGANAIRLTAQDLDWPALRDQGLVVRPTWIHWVSPAAGGSDGVLKRQSVKQRQLCRRPMRALAGMKMELSEPISPARYDEWLALYAAQVGEMRHGRNLAKFFRRSVLDPASGHGLITWRQDGHLVCGLVFRMDRDRSALAGRFGAVTATEGKSELSRGMYMALADMAADRGLQWVTLGSDVNLYGAFAGAGLCSFKLRLGFRPVPGDLAGTAGLSDVAERIVSLDGLEPPVLRFEYLSARSPHETIADYVDGPAALGLVSVSPPGLQSEVLDSLPAHLRLELG